MACYIGGLCRLGEAVSNRGGAGGGPQDTTRPASVSELVIGETPSDSCGYWFDVVGCGDPQAIDRGFGDPWQEFATFTLLLLVTGDKT